MTNFTFAFYRILNRTLENQSYPGNDFITEYYENILKK